MGITMKLPRTIEEATEAARADTELEAAMPAGMLHHYLVMKQAEQAMLNQMDDEQRRVWLMERY